MHAFPKSLINSTKNGTEKNFASQWLSISPNSMISFKFYVQTPFFSTFITLHLGKGHIQAPVYLVVWTLLRWTQNCRLIKRCEYFINIMDSHG